MVRMGDSPHPLSVISTAKGTPSPCKATFGSLCPAQVCSTKDAQTDKIALYYEPMPTAVGPLPEAMAAGLRVHKLILMDTKEVINRVRPEVERLIGERATFTQV